MSKIVWKDKGFAKVAGIDPDEAVAELEAIRERDGLLKPKAIVTAATPKTSPLHPAFEWRNNVAAQAYREWQARQVVRAVRIVVDEPGEDQDENRTAPYYVSVTQVSSEGNPEKGYQKTEIAVTRPDEWFSAMTEFSIRIAAARRAISELEAIAAKTQDHDRLASIAMAAKALSVAASALAMQ